MLVDIVQQSTFFILLDIIHREFLFFAKHRQAENFFIVLLDIVRQRISFSMDIVRHSILLISRNQL